MDIIIPLIIVWQGATYACVPVSNEFVMRCWPVEQKKEVAL